MCKIIAIANQKGGVGKTTTTSNLGIGLAKQGKKVLLIDADAQGSLTASLGFTEPDSLEVTLATIMGNLINDEEVEPGEGILHHEEGIDLMPGNIELSGLEVSLVNVMSRETVLRSYIEIVRENYDYILIDCMPSLGMITINAFASADSILIPVQAAYLPVKGLQQLIKTVGKVKRQINPKLEIEGILLTMVDSRTNYAKDISAMLKEAYGSRVRIFANIIPISVRAAEISAEGVSIYKHDPKGKVASAYRHQQEAFGFVCRSFGLLPEPEAGPPVLKSSGCALLMEMGTGKSITSIAITGALAKAGRIGRVLIVAPLSILGVWEAEFARFADFPYFLAVLEGTGAKKLDTLRHMTGAALQVAVVNYESAWRMEKDLLAWRPGLIIADEGHKIKTHNIAASIERVYVYGADRVEIIWKTDDIFFSEEMPEKRKVINPAEMPLTNETPAGA